MRSIQDSDNLIWIDLEMTGLDTDNDYIIEIATIVTDSNLEILEEGSQVHVRIADTGQGIPKTQRAQIFEPGVTSKKS